MATGGLTRWFKEQWVDISRPKEGGGFEPCGRKDADEGKYPKCVPASRAAKMTEAEIKSAVSRKRRAESTERREGKKPINVKTKVEKKNVPTDPKLYAEVKAAAKRKFDVYPSAYANGWLVQEYKRRGGKYKSVAKGSVGLAKHVEHDQSTHGRRKVAVGGKYPTVDNEKDTEGKYSAEARQLAASVRASRMEHEPQLTDSLMRSLERHGANAYGLKFRVKTEKSIARKIDADSAEKGQFRAEVAESMNDIIRYTGVVEEGKYSDTIWKVLDDLRADGIEFDRIKNFWPKGDPYDGINIKMKHPAGFKFELQFHTPESIETKNKSHKIYDLYREEADTKKRYTYYNRMVRLWAQVNTPSGALEIGEQISESFVAMTKAAYRTIKRLDDNDNVVAEYRFSDANKTIVEQRKTSDGWVDAHGEVVWYLISGTWGYEPSSESVAKHLGTAHDQTTHGRRKTSTGLSAVREAARNTELSLHRYGEIEGQTSFFTDEPYTKPKQAEYKVGIGTVKDTTPVPKPAGDLSETTEEEDLEIARSVFDMDIELDDGRLVEVRVADVRASYSSMRVVGSVMVDGEVAGRFDRHLDFDSGYAGNSSFAINKNFQGQGLGSTILRHWEDQYHQAGLYEMYVTAQSSPGGYNGAYTWLRYGYQPEDPVSLFTAYVESVVADIDDVDSAVDAADSLRPLFDASMSDATADGLREKILYVGMDEMTLVDVEQDIRDAMYGGYWADPLEIVAVDDKFANYLKNGDISWNGRKDTEPLFYNQYAKSDGGSKAAREVISRWMIEDPAGLENDDPQFWSDIRAAFKKVKKDNPTVNSVHVASVMGSKKRRKKKRGISGMAEVDKGDYPGHPFRGNQWVGGIPEGGGKGKAPSYEKGKGKTGGKKAKEEALKRKVASFATMAKLVPKGSGSAQNTKEETSKSIAAAITAAGVADTPKKAHKIALELQDLVQQHQVIYPFPAFKAGRATPLDGPMDHINAETLASGVLRAWADSSTGRYSLVLQLAALHSLGVIDDYEGVNFHNYQEEFTNDRDIYLDENVSGGDSVVAYDQMRERFPKAMEFVEAVVKAQYEATQQKFKEAGVTHVTVSRGIKVTKGSRADFMKALKVDEDSSKSLEQTVGILGDIDERPLSSWTADTGKAIEFAVDYGSAELDARSTVMSAVVPVELVFSTPQTGLGSPAESEVVLLSGNYSAMAFMHDDRGAYPSSAMDIEDMVTFSARSGDIGKADRPKKSVGTILNEGNNTDWIKTLAKGKRKKMSKKEPIKDPKGGLTAAGRAHFKRKEGANLKPGVKGKADTPEKMRRKGSFLTRFYTNPSGPLQNDKGEPTRLALAAAAWGEPVPKNRSDAAKLAAKGRRLLERYENVKKHATHDQKTHGRRKTATGGGTKPKMRRITEAASKRAKQLAAMARDGGFTFNPKRSEMRSKGVAVAVGKENERKVRADEFSEESIRQYTRDHAELLAQPRHHLGAWRETEKGVDYIYLDVSVVMPSLESAADLGRANDQIGIFDLSTFTTYYRAPDKEGDLKYIPLNLTDASGYDRTAATDMATNVGKADGDKGVMFVPGEMLDESSLPKIVERIMALKPVGKSEKESRKNS